MSKTEINLNWPILGNDHIVKFLAKSIYNNKISGTYIFSGPDDLGKTTVANYFAYSLLCQNKDGEKKLPCGHCIACKQNKIGKSDKNEDAFESVHVDFHLIKREKDKKNVSISQIREFIHSLEMSSFLNSYKIGIIKNAESLSGEAANALLKTLEEPKKNVIIILITSDLNALPETILSRSQILKFKPIKTEIIYDYLVKTHGVNRSQAKNLSRLCLGRPALALKFLEDIDFYDNYLSRVNVFLSLIHSDMNGRFNSLNELLPAKSAGQEAVKIAKRIIEVWNGLIRDMLLLKFEQLDLVQHEIVIKELENQKISYTVPALLELTDSLKQADQYLKSNVNPRTVLENFMMAI